MSELQSNIPDNHVVGILNGGQSSQEAVEALHREGFEEAGVLRGEEALEKIDSGADSGGLKGMMKRLSGHLGDEVAYLEQYERAAEKGMSIIAVKVDSHEDAEKAKGILERFGTTDIRFFGRFAVTDMTPASNPSAPSGEL